MDIIEKAIRKAISIYGSEVLSDKELFCTLLDDMLVGQVELRHFINEIYNDEIGNILCKASKAAYSDKECYFEELNYYLKGRKGFNEPTREKFINLFRSSFRRMVEVKKYKDYASAVQILKQEFGDTMSDYIIESFIEENRLFSRFSITVDDVKRDMKLI